MKWQKNGCGIERAKNEIKSTAKKIYDAKTSNWFNRIMCAVHITVAN